MKASKKKKQIKKENRPVGWRETLSKCQLVGKKAQLSVLLFKGRIMSENLCCFSCFGDVFLMLFPSGTNGLSARQFALRKKRKKD